MEVEEEFNKKKHGTIWTRKFDFKLDDETKPKKLMGVVELAPLNVPWKRRMQTLAVAIWISTFFFAGPAGLGFLLYLTFYTSYWWLALMYLAWWVYDRDTVNRGGRRSNWVRNWKLWRNYCNFFPIRLVKTVDFDPSKNYLLASHPHGVLCSGAIGSFGTEGAGFSDKYPLITPYLLTLDGQFLFPFYREFLMGGGLCSVSKKSINYLLSKADGGNAVILVPGGAPESLDSHPGPQCVLHLLNRKGFIKLALKNGAALVPVFSFGETDIYDQIPNEKGSRLRKVQDLLQRVLSIAPVLILGRGIFQYTFGIIPQRRPITVVVGAPMAVEKTENPTMEQIDALHQKYIDSLTKLFNKYKGRYASHPDAYLTLI